MDGNEKNKSNKLRNIIIGILGSLMNLLIVPIIIIIILGLLGLFIYSSISGLFGSNGGKLDDGISTSLAGALSYSIFKDGFHSNEPLGFPITGSFPKDTFGKHKGDGRWATVAIDFNGFHRGGGYIDDTRNMMNYEENIGGSKKKISEYDLEYMKGSVKELHSGPKHCTVSKSVSRIKTAPIYSTLSGKIVKLKRNSDCFGNQIVIKGEKYATNYAHLDIMHGELGNEVKAGELIGTMGNSGNSSGAHLHYDILQNRGLIGNLINTITNYSGSLGIANFFAIKQEEYMRLVTMYGAYDGNGRVWGDHVGKNSSKMFSKFLEKGNKGNRTGMQEFLDGGVEAVKWQLLNHGGKGALKNKSEDSVDFYSKLITWTIIGREKSSSYNKDSELRNYYISRDGGAGVWQTQEPNEELKREYERFEGYNGEDGQGKVTKGYGCGWDWRKIIHQDTSGREALMKRGCNLEKDTRFDVEKSTQDYYGKEIGNKIQSCKSSGFGSKKKWDDLDDFERGLCIVTRYNGGTLWKDMQDYQIKFLRDVMFGEKNYESCRELEKRKENEASSSKGKRVYYDNCSYSYQFALNYAKMIKFGSTQFNGLSRFQKDSKKTVIDLGSSEYKTP